MYRGQLFQSDLVKCQKQKEIMDHGDLATALTEGSLAAILLTVVQAISQVCAVCSPYREGDFEDEAVERQNLFVLDRQPSLGENWGAQSPPLQCSAALAHRVNLHFDYFA